MNHEKRGTDGVDSIHFACPFVVASTTIAFEDGDAIVFSKIERVGEIETETDILESVVVQAGNSGVADTRKGRDIGGGVNDVGGGVDIDFQLVKWLEGIGEEIVAAVDGIGGIGDAVDREHDIGIGYRMVVGRIE